jgi:hypothetical protein
MSRVLAVRKAKIYMYVDDRGRLRVAHFLCQVVQCCSPFDGAVIKLSHFVQFNKQNKIAKCSPSHQPVLQVFLFIQQTAFDSLRLTNLYCFQLGLTAR